MLPEQQIIPPPRRRRGVGGEDVNVLVPLSAIARELGVKPRTVLAWSEKRTSGFPPLVKIGKQHFGSRRTLEKWKTERLADTQSGEA